jgi:hypothetical protein
LEQVIADITAKVTETSAIALTIEATIADEEAGISENEAQWALDDLYLDLEYVQVDIATNDFYLSMTVDEFEIANYESILKSLRVDEADILESIQDQILNQE